MSVDHNQQLQKQTEKQQEIRQQTQQTTLANPYEHEIRLFKNSSYEKSEWITESLQRGEITDEAIDSAATATYQKVFDQKKLGFFEKRKIRKEFKRKFSEAKEARRVIEEVKDEKFETIKPYSENLTKILKLNKDYCRNATNCMLVLNDEEKRLYTEKLASGNDDMAREAVYMHIKKMLEPIDFTKFEYKNDKEMLKVYRENKELISSGMVLEKSVNSYKALGGDLTPYEEARARQTAHMIEAIKIHIEARLLVMQTPEYMLIRDEKFDSISAKEAERLSRERSMYADNNSMDSFLRDTITLKSAKEKLRGERDKKLYYNGKLSTEFIEDNIPSMEKEKNKENSNYRLKTVSIRLMEGFNPNWVSEADVPDEFLENTLKSQYFIRNPGGVFPKERLPEMKKKLRANLNKAFMEERIFRDLDIEVRVNWDATLEEIPDKRLVKQREDSFLLSLFESAEDQKRIAKGIRSGDKKLREEAIKECLDKFLEAEKLDFKYTSVDELLPKFRDLSQISKAGMALKKMVSDLSPETLEGLGQDMIDRLNALGAVLETIAPVVEQSVLQDINIVGNVLSEYTDAPDYDSLTLDQIEALRDDYEKKAKVEKDKQLKKAYDAKVIMLGNKYMDMLMRQQDSNGVNYEPANADMKDMLEKAKAAVKH